MKTIIHNMEKLKNQHGVGLLPNYFKKLGIIVMILALVPAVFVKGADIEISPASKEIFRLLTMNAFILGLLFVAWAEDKLEDEITVALRLKAMASTFIWAVLYVIIKPFIDMLFHEPVADLKSQELVLSMLFIYMLMYYVQRKIRRAKPDIAQG
ncbi:MAG TPA: hypothetical protein VK166_19160 [Chitinophagaceae bacterium]|nr:hypothetical protein [Chitinophagaceae bacterium]